MARLLLALSGITLLPSLGMALVGGAPAVPGRFPGLVLVKVGESEVCTATKIAPLHFLLAGHCVIERRVSLDKINQNGRVREGLSPGEWLFYQSGVEQAVDGAWPHQARIARTWSHPSYQYSQYEALGLRPEITSDVAVIVLEEEPAQLASLPIASEKIDPGIAVTKIGFGCEAEEQKEIEACRQGQRPLRLKSARSQVVDGAKALPKLPRFAFEPMAGLGEKLRQSTADWYLFTPGRYFEGTLQSEGASLSYFDSGGPLLQEQASGGWRIVGVNSRGGIEPVENGDERVVFDLHTRLDQNPGGETGQWLARVKEWKPGSQRLAPTQVLEALVNLKNLTSTETGFEERDRRGRPAWISLRGYFQTREHQTRSGRVTLSGPRCPIRLTRVIAKTVPDGAESELKLGDPGPQGVPFQTGTELRVGAIHPIFEKQREPDLDADICRLSLWID